MWVGFDQQLLSCSLRYRRGLTRSDILFCCIFAFLEGDALPGASAVVNAFFFPRCLLKMSSSMLSVVER